MPHELTITPGVLRKVDHLELIEEAVPTATKKSTGKKTLVQSEVADVFGI